MDGEEEEEEGGNHERKNWQKLMINSWCDVKIVFSDVQVYILSTRQKTSHICHALPSKTD